MMSYPETVAERAHVFIDRLKELSKGELAVLKRNAGETVACAHGAMGVFYRITAGLNIAPWLEETYFLVATLYALNPQESDQGCFGDTMLEIRDLITEELKIKDKSKSLSLDKRMANLLECGAVTENNRELTFKLRQAIHLTKSHMVGVNWPVLLADLCAWDHESKWVQRKWARAYFGNLDVNNKEKE